MNEYIEKAKNDFSVDGNTDGLPTYSKDDLVIAVIDTGIDPTHMDLDEGKVIGWVDFVRDKTEPYDDHGHGTHVASIGAGTGEGSSGTYTGVAPGAALVGVKVLDRRGSGTWEDCNAGIQWVIDNKDTYSIELMNISWGASGSSDGTSVTEQLVNKAVAAGIVAVLAAGNDGPKTYTIGVPAAAEEAITVGAMADVGEVGFFQAYWSSRGPTAANDEKGIPERIKPDISSPGWKIMAAKYNSTDDYTEKSGTSMATPFVAGVAALMLDAESSLLPSDVKTTIMDTAVDWGPSDRDIDYGAGRLDAYEAIRVAVGGTTTGPTVPNHEYVEDSLDETNTEDWWDINIADTQYPIAITMIMPDWASSSDPDFDIKLYDPSGEQVASSAGIKRQETIAYQPSVTGTYKLKVYIYSGSGPYFVDLSAGTSAVDNPPVVSLVSPADGSHVKGSVTIQIDATDDKDKVGSLNVDVSLDGGSTWLDTTYSSTSGYYEYSWDTTAVADGTYTIDARATDSSGNTTNAAQVSITVDNTQPSVAIDSPASGAVVKGDVEIVASASDATSGVAGVEWRVVGVTSFAPMTLETDGKWHATWDSTTVADGSYSIEVRATDNAGNQKTASVGVTVDNPPAAPTNLSAAAGDSIVDLAWDRNTEADMSRYNVYRSTDNVSFTKIAEVAQPDTATVSYSDTNVINGTTYYYYVTAVDTALQESTVSNTVSATPSTGVLIWSSDDLEAGIWSESGNPPGRDGRKDYSYTPDSAITNIQVVRVNIGVVTYDSSGSTGTDDVPPYLEVYVKEKGNTFTQINGSITPTDAGTYTFESTDATVLSKIIPGETNEIRVYIRSLNKDRNAGTNDLVEVDYVEVEIEYQP